MNRLLVAAVPLALVGARAVAPTPATSHPRAPAATPAADFVLDVLPLLQRAGCASAYCHGSATGRGGFKLSLFGSDPAADHAAITQELDGRRIDRADAERSLLLQKPALRVPHGGGRRLTAGGTEYRLVREWIASGAPWRRGPERVLVALELELAAGSVRARARFGDGSERDVTSLATFTSTDPEVAAVAGDGAVTVGGPGEAWLLARYGNQTARVAVRRPFGNVPAAASDHPLDRVWLARLAELGLAPAPVADPATLRRRLFLDLLGRPPAPAEQSQDPRDAGVVAALLARREFAETFGAHLARWFGAGDARDFVEAVARGDSLPAIARLALQRELSARRGDPRDRAERVGAAFLGVRIGCARCHDHPLDRWRRAEHLAFSACFADPRPAPGGGTTAGKLFDPDTGDEVPPALLPVAGARTGADVVAFVLDEGHGMLVRNVANRVFAALNGRGLVEAEDDHRLSNPAVHEPLLDALAADWRHSGGDLRALVRTVVTSRLYAAASEPAGGDEVLERARVRWFARREARPLDPALLARAHAAVLGVPVVAAAGAPLARELALQNGPLLHETLAGGTLVDAILDLGRPERRLDDLYALVLARAPRADERERFGPLLAGADPRAALHDLAFALLASREFCSNR